MNPNIRILLGNLRNRINAWLEPHGYFLITRKEATKASIASLVALVFDGRPSVKFLQIGAHDGVSDDHLHWMRTQTHWTGYMLEPNPLIFPALENNCRIAGNSGVVPLQIALSLSCGQLSFFRIKSRGRHPSLPDGSDQWSSLSREKLVSEGVAHGLSVDEMNAQVEEVKVETYTLEKLFAEYKIKEVDLILFDVEGLDFALLKAFPLKSYLPLLVICEWAFMRSDELAEIVEKFNASGYRWLRVGQDIAFIRGDVLTERQFPKWTQ